MVLSTLTFIDKLTNKRCHLRELECVGVGEGGFGQVWRGTSRSGTQVAVKRFKSVLKDQQLLENELVYTRTLQHPNIISALAGTLYVDGDCVVILMVMHLYTLSLYAAIFKDSEYYTQNIAPNRVSIAFQIFAGLTYLHERQLCHRDISSANMLVRKTSVLELVICDLARVVQTDNKMPHEYFHDDTSLTNNHYTAPERLFAPRKALTTQSDVYAGALVALEMWTLRPMLIPPWFTGTSDRTPHLARFMPVQLMAHGDLAEHAYYSDLPATVVTTSASIRKILNTIRTNATQPARPHFTNKDYKRPFDILRHAMHPDPTQRTTALACRDSFAQILMETQP